MPKLVEVFPSLTQPLLYNVCHKNNRLFSTLGKAPGEIVEQGLSIVEEAIGVAFGCLSGRRVRRLGLRGERRVRVQVFAVRALVDRGADGRLRGSF